MNPQTVFILDKKKKILIFLGLLDKDISISQVELSDVLGLIISQSNTLKLNSFSNAQINDKFYFFGNFEKLVIIFQHLKDDPPPDKFLIGINKIFINKYWNILDNYSNKEISNFNPFIKVIKEILPSSKLKESEVMKDGPIINAMKRETYPQGISDYKRDEILWNEARLVKEEYPGEILEGLVFNLQIYLRVFLTYNYKIFLDFSDYPSKPIIGISEDLNIELGKNLEELLYFYGNWDEKKPPHIIEIVKELETVLWQLNLQNKLSETGDMTFPDLKSLPKISEKPEEKE